MDDEIKKAAGEVADDGKWDLLLSVCHFGNKHCNWPRINYKQCMHFI